jgi:hypothetical protein
MMLVLASISASALKSLAFLVLFKEINAHKRQLQLMPEKTASSKKSYKEG